MNCAWKILAVMGISAASWMIYKMCCGENMHDITEDVKKITKKMTNTVKEMDMM